MNVEELAAQLHGLAEEEAQPLPIGYRLPETQTASGPVHPPRSFWLLFHSALSESETVRINAVSSRTLQRRAR